MWSRFKSILLGIRTSLLFVPLLFALGGIGLSFVTSWLDQSGYLGGLIKMIPGSGINQAGARSVLSTIASGMLSVTSIVISLTFIALTLVSSQLGPRLLLFFMRDRSTKIVVGIFVATIIYSLVTMARVGGRGDATYSPHLSFMVAILMALASLGAMIYFVDHIARTIQADAVVAQLTKNCDAAIDKVIHGSEANDAPDGEVDAFAARFKRDPHRWEATRSGYLAAVDYQALVEAAKEHAAFVKLYVRVNTFVFDTQLLAVFLCDKDQVKPLREALENVITMTARHTPAQQVNFEMSALTEVALRALSPGINDPYTAATCVNYLGNTLSRIAFAASKLQLLRDEDGDFRVLRPADNLPFFLHECIAPIIEAADGSPIALYSLIRTLNRLAKSAHRKTDIDAIARQRKALRQTTAKSIRHESERQRLLAIIDSGPGGQPPV